MKIYRLLPILFFLFTSFLLVGQENTPALCNDGIDNDGDGFIDCEDSDCFLSSANNCANCERNGSSFADFLIDSEIECVPPNKYANAFEAIGSPNTQLIQDGNFVSLGREGSVTLGFSDNLLSNSGTPALDIWVYEVGQQVEDVDVAVRPYDSTTLVAVTQAGLIDLGEGFYLVGEAMGSTSGIDIDVLFGTIAPESLFFDAVRIIDKLPTGCSNLTPGSDIDAVCAVTSIPTTLGENCFNGVDDLGNGDVDLNDAECDCETPLELSLIPNPSFELMDCCPSEAEFICAAGWQEASLSPIDYLHECDVVISPEYGYAMPLPLTDGEGAVGLNDGTANDPTAKEYIGNCIFEPMLKDSSYTFEMSIGFPESDGSNEFDLVLYATTDCSNLPLQSKSCPTSQGFTEVLSFNVTGNNEWKQYTFNFDANDNFKAVLIGPSCSVNDSVDLNPYFFIDRLVLAEDRVYNIDIDSEGSVCSNNLVLNVDARDNELIQWYRDGIAVSGANADTLSLSIESDSSGDYQALLYNSNYCLLSNPFPVELPPPSEAIVDSLCFGEFIIINDIQYNTIGDYVQLIENDSLCDSFISISIVRQSPIRQTISLDYCFGDTVYYNDVAYFNSAFTYTQTLASFSGCDTMLTIILVENDNYNIQFDTLLCPGDMFMFGDTIVSSSGSYSYLFETELGCDSLVSVNVEQGFNSSGNETIELCGGDTIEVNGISYSDFGLYQQQLVAQNGCDSFLDLNIIPIQDYFVENQFFICESDSIIYVGQTFYETGEYSFLEAGGGECDTLYNIRVLQDPTCVFCGVNVNTERSSKLSIVKLESSYIELTFEHSNTILYKDIITEAHYASVIISLLKTFKDISINSLHSHVDLKNKLYQNIELAHSKSWESSKFCHSILGNQWNIEHHNDLLGQSKEITNMITRLNSGGKLTYVLH